MSKTESLEWYDVDEKMPEKSEVNSKKEFLTRGYYEIGESRGKTVYRILKMYDMIPENYGFFFETPRNFEVSEWAELNTLNPTR